MRGAFSLPLVILYIGRLISTLGDWIYMIAISLILAEHHGIALTFMWIAKLIGMFSGKLIAGSIADRIGYKITAIGSDILRACLIALMPLFITHSELFILIGGVSFISTLFSAAMFPMITVLTDVSSRYRVNSILSTIGSIALVLGPITGGLLLLKNTSIPFMVESLSFVFSAVTFLFIRIPKKSFHTKDKTDSTKITNRMSVLLNDIKSSILYILSNRTLLAIALATTFLGLSAAMEVYEVLFVTKGVGLGVESYTIIVTINGLSFLLGNILNVFLGSSMPSTYLYPIGIGVTVVMGIAYATSQNLLALCISTLLMSVGLTTANTASDSISQTVIPVHIQGRITSFQTILPEFAVIFSTVSVGGMLTFMSIRSIFVILSIIAAGSLPFSLFVLKKGNYSAQ